MTPKKCMDKMVSFYFIFIFLPKKRSAPAVSGLISKRPPYDMMENVTKVLKRVKTLNILMHIKDSIVILRLLKLLCPWVGVNVCLCVWMREVFSAADHRRPVRQVLYLSDVIQLLASVCQSELVAQAHFTLRRQRSRHENEPGTVHNSTTVEQL